MRYGAPIFDSYSSPSEWVERIRKHGYSAALSPVKSDCGDAEAIAFGIAAGRADIVIAEQGAWHCNCLSPDNREREQSVALCIRSLEIAELLGAKCCVAISGSLGKLWCGPHKDNISDRAFEMVVENTRRIIDAVQPKKSSFTWEPMPWTFPYNSQSQLRLLEAVDRAAFAVHYDPINMIYSPDRYFNSGKYVSEFTGSLGQFIKSCHIKDIILTDDFIWQLHECPPGEGAFDYDALFMELDKLDPDLPVMPEHLPDQNAYDKAGAFIKRKLEDLGIRLR